ncbi:MAG: sodium:proton antiporter NhaD, partial [Desulfosarcinaceae bacterium]
AVLSILVLPLCSWASGQAEAAGHPDFSSSVYGYLGLLLFVIAYSAVPLENKIHLRKSKPVILAAGLIWVLVALAFSSIGDIHTAHEAIKDSLLEYAELFLFLLAAMTYINAMEERNVFQALRSHLVSRGFSLRRIFWITGILAFLISPVADNLTTALLMGAVVMAVGGDNKKFVAVACINIVVAANAGGAFSPFGDITTLMVWQKGKLQFGEFFDLFLPSLVNWLIPAVLMSLTVDNSKPTVEEETISMKIGARRIMILFLLTIVTAVSFHNFLHLPPAAGMMLGMGYLGLLSYYIKIVEGRVDRYDTILGQRSHETLHPLGELMRKYRDIAKAVENLKEPTFILDNDHIVTHWNKAMAALTGVPAREVVGTRRHWHPFYPEERLVMADLVLERYSQKVIGQHYGNHYRRISVTGDAYEAAIYFPHFRGEGRWFSAAAAPILNEEDQVTGVVEMLEDHSGKTSGATHFDMMKRIARAEWDTLLFFYGVILCVGGLAQLGYLTLVSKTMYMDLGPTAANTLVGVLSAVVDNIPVMFAVLTMNPTMDMPQWLLVTLTAGTGGSMLAIGSAAGVALMGSARGTYTFGSHLKWTPVIALGYAVSILIVLMI